VCVWHALKHAERATDTQMSAAVNSRRHNKSQSQNLQILMHHKDFNNFLAEAKEEEGGGEGEEGGRHCVACGMWQDRSATLS